VTVIAVKTFPTSRRDGLTWTARLDSTATRTTHATSVIGIGIATVAIEISIRSMCFSTASSYHADSTASRGRLFHVQFKPLYEAIGEPDNRHRRPASLGRLVERLMLLDAVLADRRLGWLGTARDKHTHFRKEIRTADVADFIADLKKPRVVNGLEGRKLTPASINRTTGLLRHMLNWAVGREFLDRTPFRRGTEVLIRLERGQQTTSACVGR
jgi:hypothetical protein